MPSTRRCGSCPPRMKACNSMLGHRAKLEKVWSRFSVAWPMAMVTTAERGLELIGWLLRAGQSCRQHNQYSIRGEVFSQGCLDTRLGALDNQSSIFIGRVPKEYTKPG